MIAARTIVVLPLLAVAACSSIVSDPCVAGYAWSDGACVARADGPDGGGTGDGGSHDGATRDAGVARDSVVTRDTLAVDATLADAFACTSPLVMCDGACVDTTSDPNDCGRCDHVCASGICSASVCVGDAAGHVVAIGHDYANYHPAMARVLGNALALRAGHTVRVGWYQGSASEASDGNERAAAQQALAAMGHNVTPSTFATPPTLAQLGGVDVIVIEPQTGDGDAIETVGAAWAHTAQQYLAATGVIVVLEGSGGVSYRFAQGAGLFAVGAPVDDSGTALDVVDTTDAVAQDVTSPYLGEASTVGFPGAPAGVVATPGGEVVVFHETF